MDTISLIVRGDEFGICHAVNQAIYEAFETGILTCASLVVAGPWVAEAAALIHEHPEWEIGLQLVLHCPTTSCRWGPVAGAAAVPSLVEATGTFPSSLAADAKADETLHELEAQVERVRAWRITPAYLEYDGTSHPAVETSLHQLSERFGVPVHMTAWGVQPLPLSTQDDRPWLTALQESLASLKPGVYLWATRPAQDSPETWSLWPNSEMAKTRQADYQALCSAEVRGLLDQRGVERISFRQYIEDRLGTEVEE
jgi:predicted glycoside hydrolase/deacetylase ChbG (UPF0249 family)